LNPHASEDRHHQKSNVRWPWNSHFNEQSSEPSREQAAAGRLTTSKAAALALDSTLRLCGAADARC
jgi:hypothetical protein